MIFARRQLPTRPVTYREPSRYIFEAAASGRTAVTILQDGCVAYYVMTSDGLLLWQRSIADGPHSQRKREVAAAEQASLLHRGCDHDWQEQEGEPPVDICNSCGETRH